MKKYFKYYAICWSIAIAVFNMVTFITLNTTCDIATLTSSFWIGYAFITIVFFCHLICSVLFFKEENKDKIFMNISIFRLAYIALIASIIASLISMCIPFIPYWIGIVVDVLIIGYYAIAITKVTLAIEVVENTKQDIIQKTSFIKMLCVEADTLKSKAKTDEARIITNKVYDAIRYSDPISSSFLDEINSQIQDEFELFANAIYDGDDELASSIGEEIINLIESRNKTCRTIK